MIINDQYYVNSVKPFNKLISLFSILYFYIFVIQKPLVTVLYVAVLSVFSILILLRAKFIPLKVLFLLLFVFLILSPGLLKIEQGFSKFFYFYMEMVIFFFCWIASLAPKSLLKAVNVIFYSFAAFVSFSLVFVWGSPEPLSLIIPGSSQNGIPSYFIIIVSVLLFLSFHLRTEFPIVPVVFTLFISFLGEGRGSLIVSAYIFVCVLFFWFFHQSQRGIFLKTLVNVVFFSSLLVFILYLPDLYDFAQTRTKLNVGFLDYNRTRILDSYLSSLSAIDWFLGAGYEQTVVASEYNSNPHISYVRLHSFFGFAAVFFVLISPLLIFLKGFSLSNSYLVALLYAMILRAATEPVLFPTLFDFFYFSCFFVFFRKAKV